MNDAELKRKAYAIRRTALEMIARAKTGHVGGDFSEADLLTTLFYEVLRKDPHNPKWPERDRYIQSKGHCVEVYLAILADLGYFPREELNTYSAFGSRLIGHPNNKVPGVEMNSGALGHGLSVGVGMAIAGKMDRKDYHVYVLMGDGEQEEGSVWEAAMAAANYKLDNLTAIVDRNRLQISGPTESVMNLEPFRAKWEAFGFHVVEIDGHDYGAIRGALTLRQPGSPVLVIADTVKGKGISYMENVASWHHGIPDEAQLKQAIRELEEVIDRG
ncbi:MAG: transketolase [Eubacteriales bacterium]|nr:transketolase [Eubacteriales bacterium]